MNISDALAGSTLTTKGKTFFIGLFPYVGAVNYKEAVVPKVFIKEGGDWRFLGESDTRWENGESRNLTPTKIAQSDLKKLNVFISAEFGESDTPWFQEYLDVYNTMLEFNGILVAVKSK